MTALKIYNTKSSKFNSSFLWYLNQTYEVNQRYPFWSKESFDEDKKEKQLRWDCLTLLKEKKWFYKVVQYNLQSKRNRLHDSTIWTNQSNKMSLKKWDLLTR